MKARFNLEEVDSMYATMHITMRIREWKAVRENLKKADDRSARDFAWLISGIVDRAEKQFQEESERDG